MDKTTDNKKGKFFADKGKIKWMLLATVGIVLILIGGSIGGEEKKDTVDGYTDVGFYTDYLEDEIRNLCLSIYGINDAEVFLTLDCSSEYMYLSDNASDYLILSGDNGEHAVMLCEIYPKVRGVAVVCTGGNTAAVQEMVTSLLSASLGLPSNKIKVAG